MSIPLTVLPDEPVPKVRPAPASPLPLIWMIGVPGKPVWLVPSSTTGSVIVGRADSGLIVRPAEETVTRPILSMRPVNQRLPSEPAVIPKGSLAAADVNSVTVPLGVIRPIWAAPVSVNQRLPSGPFVIPSGWLLAVGIGNSVIVPLGVIRPILLASDSVNQRLPSGPVVIPWVGLSWLLAVGIGNSVIMPAGVMRPILLLSSSTNQRLPSGPAVIETGWLLTKPIGNSVIVPLGVIRPILSPTSSANQRLPSGPAVIPMGKLLAVGIVNSVIVPLGVIRPILLASDSVNQRLLSGPAAIPAGWLPDAGREVAATAPTEMLKSIVSDPEVALASRIACRSEPGPLSALLVTRKSKGARSLRSSSSSKSGLNEGRLRRAALLVHLLRRDNNDIGVTSQRPCSPPRASQ